MQLQQSHLTTQAMPSNCSQPYPRSPLSPHTIAAIAAAAEQLQSTNTQHYPQTHAFGQQTQLQQQQQPQHFPSSYAPFSPPPQQSQLAQLQPAPLQSSNQLFGDVNSLPLAVSLPSSLTFSEPQRLQLQQQLHSANLHASAPTAAPAPAPSPSHASPAICTTLDAESAAGLMLVHVAAASAVSPHRRSSTDSSEISSPEPTKNEQPK